MTTRHELSVVGFFLYRIAVASPQWENGLSFVAIVFTDLCFVFVLMRGHFYELGLSNIRTSLEGDRWKYKMEWLTGCRSNGTRFLATGGHYVALYHSTSLLVTSWIIKSVCQYSLDFLETVRYTDVSLFHAQIHTPIKTISNGWEFAF
jgi:hypothetical protein